MSQGLSSLSAQVVAIWWDCALQKRLLQTVWWYTFDVIICRLIITRLTATYFCNPCTPVTNAVLLSDVSTKQGIHQNQTPPRYRNAASHTSPYSPRRPNETSSIKPEVHIQSITTLLEEDRATFTGDLHNKFREDCSSSSRDMLADRHTDRQTDRNTLLP